MYTNENSKIRSRKYRRVSNKTRRLIFFSCIILIAVSIIFNATMTLVHKAMDYEFMDSQLENYNTYIEETTSAQTYDLGLSEDEQEFTNILVDELEVEIQEYAYNKCVEVDIPYEVFMALMWNESKYDTDALSQDGMDCGLCQIRKSNHNWIEKELGRDLDFFNPYDNIDASIFMLTHYRDNYNPDNLNTLLMIYNMGPSGAKKCWDSGYYSTKYSRAILNKAQEFGYNN